MWRRHILFQLLFSLYYSRTPVIVLRSAEWRYKTTLIIFLLNRTSLQECKSQECRISRHTLSLESRPVPHCAFDPICCHYLLCNILLPDLLIHVCLVTTLVALFWRYFGIGRLWIDRSVDLISRRTTQETEFWCTPVQTLRFQPACPSHFLAISRISPGVPRRRFALYFCILYFW